MAIELHLDADLQRRILEWHIQRSKAQNEKVGDEEGDEDDIYDF